MILSNRWCLKAQSNAHHHSACLIDLPRRTAPAADRGPLHSRSKISAIRSNRNSTRRRPDSLALLIGSWVALNTVSAQDAKPSVPRRRRFRLRPPGRMAEVTAPGTSSRDVLKGSNQDIMPSEPNVCVRETTKTAITANQSLGWTSRPCMK